MNSKGIFENVLKNQFSSNSQNVNRMHDKVTTLFSGEYDLFYFTNPFRSHGEISLFYFYPESIVKATYDLEKKGTFNLSQYPRRFHEKKIIYGSHRSKDIVVELILESGETLKFNSELDQYEDFEQEYPSFVENVFKHA